MEIVNVRRNFVSLRDIRVILVCRRCERISIAKSLGLLESLVGPYASIKICSLVLQEVHGYIKELKAGTAAEENHLMSIRDVEQFLPIRANLIHDLTPFFRPVRYGKH